MFKSSSLRELFELNDHGVIDETTQLFADTGEDVSVNMSKDQSSVSGASNQGRSDGRKRKRSHNRKNKKDKRESTSSDLVKPTSSSYSLDKDHPNNTPTSNIDANVSDTKSSNIDNNSAIESSNIDNNSATESSNIDNNSAIESSNIDNNSAIESSNIDNNSAIESSNINNSSKTNSSMNKCEDTTKARTSSLNETHENTSNIPSLKLQPKTSSKDKYSKETCESHAAKSPQPNLFKRPLPYMSSGEEGPSSKRYKLNTDTSKNSSKVKRSSCEPSFVKPSENMKSYPLTPSTSNHRSKRKHHRDHSKSYQINIS